MRSKQRKPDKYRHAAWKVTFVDRHGQVAKATIYADTKERALQALFSQMKEIITITKEMQWVKL